MEAISDDAAATTVDERSAMLQFVAQLSAAADSIEMQMITNRHVSVLRMNGDKKSPPPTPLHSGAQRSIEYSAVTEVCCGRNTLAM